MSNKSWNDCLICHQTLKANSQHKIECNNRCYMFYYVEGFASACFDVFLIKDYLVFRDNKGTYICLKESASYYNTPSIDLAKRSYKFKSDAILNFNNFKNLFKIKSLLALQ